MNLPFLSVIVPTHKRSLLLSRALKSLKAQSAFVPIEIIVVSDTIDPDTDAVCANILTDADIYVRRNGDPGPSKSRNLALSLANGDYVVFLDDDDALHPHCVEALYSYFSDKQSWPVYFNCSVVTERRLPCGPEVLSEAEVDLAGRLNDDIYVKNQIPLPCFVFPRQLLLGLTFDPHMRAYEDWDYVLAVFERMVPKHLAIKGARIFEVRDETSDRRGNTDNATNFNAVLDYLYVYRRHPAPNAALKEIRANLMRSFNLSVPPEML